MKHGGSQPPAQRHLLPQPRALLLPAASGDISLLLALLCCISPRIPFLALLLKKWVRRKALNPRLGILG